MPPDKAFDVGQTRSGRPSTRQTSSNRPSIRQASSNHPRAARATTQQASPSHPSTRQASPSRPNRPSTRQTSSFHPKRPSIATDKFEPLAESASKPSALRFPNPRSCIISHLGDGRIHISGLRCRGAFILGCWRPVAAFAGGSLAACCLCWPLLYIRQNTTFMREGSSKLGHD